MKHILWVTLAFVLASLPLAAQDPSLPIRRLPDGKPDLNGVYSSPRFANKSTKGVPPPVNEGLVGNPPFIDPKTYLGLIRPEAQKFFNRKPTGDVRQDDPYALCLPYPFPQIAVAPYSVQFVQTPDTVVIFYEYMRFFKIIPLGTPNRPHSDWDGELTYMGNAIGWWDGDTLVVDTIGLMEPSSGLYHTTDLHVIERFTPLDAYRLDYQMTRDDPKVFTKPWGGGGKMLRQPTWKLLEYVCEENNRCKAGHCTDTNGQN